MKPLLLLLFCTLVFGCSQAENSNLQVNILNANTANLNNSNQPETAQTNSVRQAAISSEGKIFEPLTADSNYFDVVKLIGTPDVETDVAKDFPTLKLQTPIILTFYKQNACVVFLDKNKDNEKGIKSNYKYIGTLKGLPLEILHSAKSEYLDLLETVRTVVVKKILENAQYQVKGKGK